MRMRLHSIKMITALLFVFISIQPVFAAPANNFTVFGDLPFGGPVAPLFSIAAYNNSQPSANPCDGTGDTPGDVNYFQRSSQAGDSNFNDNNDYNVTSDLTSATTVYFYFCNATTAVAWISKSVAPTIDLELDLGRAFGSAAVHDDLVRNATYVCSGNLSGGTQLNTVNATLDAGNANYEQYFVIDNGNSSTTTDDTDNIYLFIDSNAAGACSFDNTTVSGIYINRTRGDYNYAVNITWEPDTRVTGDLHAELANSTIYVYNSTSDVVIGLANQSSKNVLNQTAQGADGLNDTNDDYVLYYDNSAGAIKMIVAPVNNTLGFTNTTVYGLANGITSVDLLIKVYGDTPVAAGSIIHMVNASIRGVDYTTITDKTDGLYKFFMTDFSEQANTTVNFTFAEVANGTVWLNVSRSAFANVTAAGHAGKNDTSINVSAIIGDINNLLRTGFSNVSVYANSTCGSAPLMSTMTVNPRENGFGTNDYVVYYEFNASTTTYYLNVTYNDGAFNFTSCGLSAAATAGDQDTINALMYLNGTVQSDIVTVALDTNQNSADDVITANFNSGRYYLFTASDATTDVRFDSSGGAIQLIRTKDLSTNTSVNVSKIFGETHLDLETPADDNLSIHTDANCTSAKVSSEIEQPASAAGDDYAQFYESTLGIGSSSYFINASDRAGTLFSCVRFSGGGPNYANSTNLTVKLTGQVPTGIAMIGVNNDNTAGDDIITNQTRGSTPDINYTIFMPPGDGTDQVNIYNTTGALVYRNSTVGLNNVTGSDNNATLDLARVIGDVHANLQEGSDRIRICSELTCAVQLYSSATVNPSAGAGADDDFAIYYEVNATLNRTIIMEILDESGLIDYFAYVNLTGVGDGILPGDSDTQDLTQLLNGTTSITLDFVWLDIGTDDNGVWNFSANINNGTANVTYRAYHGFTTGTNYVIKFDEDNDEATVAGNGPRVNLALTKDLSTHTTLNISTVQGDVPNDFNSDILELEAANDAACLGTSYGSNDTLAADVLPAINDYRMYFETNGSALYINFCDNTTSTVKQLERTFNRTNNNGGGNVTLNVGKLVGTLHRDFLNSTFGTDNVSIYNGTCNGASLLSSMSESPSAAAGAAGGSYEQFFESGVSGPFYINATASLNMSDVQRNFTSCIRFTFNGTAGAVASVNVTVLMEGNVSRDLASIGVDVNASADAVSDAWTNTLGVNGSSDYKLYTFPGDGSDLAYFFTGTSASGSLYLNRSAALSANLSMNVSRINGSLHVDLINTAANDSLHVYSDTACSTRLSSEDLIINGSDRYVQYYQTTPGSAFYIGLADDNVTANYSTCINPEQNMVVAGSSNNYNITVKVSGNLATGLANVYLDNDGDSATWEINASTVTATTPDTFITFFSGAADTDVNATGTTDYTELVRTAKDFSASGLVSRNFTFNVSRVDGEAHADLEVGADDRVVVTDDNACTSTMSSETETPANASGSDYQQYFEDNASGTYYVNITLNEVSANYSTCMRGGFQLANNENLTVDFTRKLSGTIPDISASVAQTDMLSAGANIDTTQGGVDVFTTTVDNGTSSFYRLFMNGTLAGAGDTVIFFGARNITIDKLNVSRSLAADTTVNVSAVVGEAHADIRTSTDFVNVCSGVPRMATFHLCALTYNSDPESPSNNKYAVVGNDYEVFFEQTSNSTHYIQVNDSDDRNYFTYINFTSSAGSVSNISLAGKLFGNVNETYNSSGINETNITLWDNADTGVWAWSRSLDNGSYRMYHNGTFDIQYMKTGYITLDWSNTSLNAVVIGVVSLNVSLESGVRIIVREFNTNNTIPNATVTLYNCTSSAGSSCNSTVILNACTVPVGNCQIAGDNISGRGLDGTYRFLGIPNGTYFQIKIERVNYTTILDPDPASESNSAYQIDGVTLQPTGLATPNTYFMQLAAIDVPSLLAPDDGAFPRNNTPTINWSRIDRAGNYELWIANNSAFTVINNALNTTSLSFTPASLPDGKYYWRVRVWDSAGNPGTWSAVRTFTIDTAVPTTSISTPVSGANLSDVIVVNGTATDTISGISYITLYSGGCGTSPITNTTSSPFTFSWQTSSADDGNKSLCAVAVDKAGNTANSTAIAVTVDNTPPSSVVITQVSGNRTSGNFVYVSGTTVVSVSASDAASLQFVRFYIDGGLNQTDSSSPFDFTWDTTKIADGSHVLKAVAYDNANNSRESAVFNVIVDNGAPESVVIVSPANDTYVTGTVTIVASVADSESIAKIDFYNGTTLIGNDTSSPFTINWATSGDGVQRLIATAYDNANNSINSSLVTVTVDNTAPLVPTVVSPTSTIYHKGGDAISVRYRYNETNPDKIILRVWDNTTIYGTATFESGLTGGNNQERNDSVIIATTAPETLYTINITVIDKVNQTQTAQTNGIVVIDNTVPSANITSPTASQSLNGTWTVTTAVADGGAVAAGIEKVEFYVNGALNQTDTSSPYTFSWNTALIPDGAYTVKIKAYDRANNTNESAGTTVSVDNGRPQDVVIVGPAHGAVVNGTIAIRVGVADTINISQVNVYNGSTLIASDTAAPWEISWNTANAADGSHTLLATAYDNNNNALNSSQINITVDNTAPSNIAVVHDPGIYDSDGVVTWNWTAPSDGSGSGIDYYLLRLNDSSGTVHTTNTTATSFTYSGLTNGQNYTLSVRVVDKVGLQSSAWTTSNGIFIDIITVPSLFAPADASYTGDNTPTFSWSNVSRAGTHEIWVDNDNDFSSPTNASNTTALSFTPGALSDAKYYWRVRLWDSAGIAGSWSTTRTLTIDTVNPSNVAVVHDPGIYDSDGVVTWNWSTSSDATSGIDYYVLQLNDSSGTVHTTNTTGTSITYSGLVNGQNYTLNVRAVDKAGLNSSASTTSNGIFIDIITVPSLFAPTDASYTGDNTPTFSWSNVSRAGTYEIWVDNDNDFSSPTNASNTTALSFTPGALSDAKYYWKVRLWSEGIAGSWSAVRTLTIDTVNPSNVAVVSDPGIYDSDGVVTWNWSTSSDATSGIDYYVLQLNDSSGTVHTTNTTGTSITYSGLVNGQNYTLNVRAVDKAGLNSSASTTSNGIFIDMTLPTVTVNTLSYGPFSANPTDPIDVDFSDNNNLDYVSYKVNANGSYTNISITINGTSYTTNWDVWGNANLQEGVNTIFLLAVDDAGNSRLATETVTYTVDTTRPRVILNFPVTGTESGTSTSFVVTTNEQAVCQFKLDSANFAAMASTNSTIHEQNLTLTGGSHTVRANCTDVAQNFNDTKSVTWTVNTDGPTLSSLIYSDLDAIVNASFTVNTTAVGNLYIISGIQYVIDNISASATNLSAPQDGAFDETTEDINFTLSVTGLNGTYTLYARANNSQGTWGGWYARTFIADTIAPNISVSSPANTTVTNVTPTISITVQDNEGGTGINISTITVADSVNGTLTVGGCGTPDNGRTYTCSFAPPGLADNSSHQINVTVKDVAGNERRFNRNFTVDTTKTITASLIASDTVGVADNTYPNGWSFTFNISTGTGGNSLRFRMDNWTMLGASNIISVFNNTYMEYTNSTGSLRNYTVKNSYDEAQDIDPLNDTDTSTAGTQSTVIIYVKIPTGTVSGIYSTGYGAGLYSTT